MSTWQKEGEMPRNDDDYRTRVTLHGAILAYTDPLIAPKAYEEGQPLRYGCTLVLLSDNPDRDQLDPALEAAARKRFGPDKKRWPPLRGLHRDPCIKDCAEHPKLGIDVPGAIFIRVSSQERPGIVYADLQPVALADLRTEVYSGRFANITVNAFAYDRKSGAGVSFALGNIQLGKHGKRLGAARPRPEDDFEAIELPPEDEADTLPDDDFVPPPRRRARR
jgi:hypothetical protein